MALTCWPVPGKAKSMMLCRALRQGTPASLRGDVFAGVTLPIAHVWNHCRRTGRRPWFHIDNSYTDAGRGRFFRVCEGSLQHLGPVPECDDTRLRALGIHEVQPMRTGGDYVLVVEQSEVFMRLQAITSRVVPHMRPKGVPLRIRAWNDKKPELARTLPEDLRHAAMVITHSSAAAVQALIMGVPVMVSDASTCWRFGSDTLDNPALPSESERWRWLSFLASRQFTVVEIGRGMAWEAIKDDRRTAAHAGGELPGDPGGVDRAP